MILPQFNLIWILLCYWLLAPIKEANSSIGSCDEYAKLPLPNASNYSETILFSSTRRDRNSWAPTRFHKNSFIIWFYDVASFFAYVYLFMSFLTPTMDGDFIKMPDIILSFDMLANLKLIIFVYFLLSADLTQTHFPVKGEGRRAARGKKWW